MEKNWKSSMDSSHYAPWKKVLRTMKLIVLLSFIVVTQTFAIKSYSQKTVLDLQMKNATIKSVLNEIEDNSRFYFLYNDDLVDVEKKVSINVKEKRIEEILNTIFKGDNVIYSIVDRQIVLSPSNKSEKTSSPLPQDKTIKGTVKDSSGELLPGVSIIVKGTTTGTVSDVDGNFSMSNIPEGTILVFSFVGMKTQEVLVGSQSSIDVTLEEDAIGIEEVVAVGYGTMKRSDLTGATSSLTPGDFNTGAIMAPEQLMQGKVTGVNITLNSGEPGANSVVRIRGGTSISAGNDPLYVIDGFPVAFTGASFEKNADDRMPSLANNPLNMINPSDIKSIDILKDASATAIYGSRGANGVIIITTKHGSDGENRIEYDSYISASSIRKKIDLLSADEFRNYLGLNQDIIKEWDDGGTNTDWQDEIFRTAISHSHNLALIKGDKQSNYRASLNYVNQEGVILSSGLEKIIGRVNINHKTLNDKLSISLNLTNAILTNDNSANTEESKGDLTGGVIRDALRYNPTFPVKDSDGNYTFRSVFNQNPVEQAEMLDDVTESFRSLGNITLDYKITRTLSFNTNIGFSKENIERLYYAPKASKIGENFGGRASQETRNNNSKLLETNFKYTKKFNEKHNVNLLVGYSYQEYNYKGTFNRTENFISDATTYNNLDGGVVYYQPTSYRSVNKLISFYGRVNYNFDNRFLITSSLRRDGSSRFGNNNKWGLFPSAALAWRIIEEKFMKSQEMFSNFKLRLGYGVTGNQEIGNYLSLPTLSAGVDKYIFGGQVVTAVGPDQYYNPDLKWETTTQMNIGVDFGLWDNLINGSIDLYEKNTTDLLLRFSVPQPAVVNTTVANVGEIQNKGIEVDLNGIIIKNDNLEWKWNTNLSRNINEVISLSNKTWKTENIYTQAIPAPGFSGVNSQIIEPGEAMGSFYGYQYIGIGQDGEQQFLDINKDGQILPNDDKMGIGNYNPDFIYGFGTTVTYKKLSLNASLRGAYGVDVLNATAMDIENISKLPGFNTTPKALDEGLSYGTPTIYSSKWVQDASFLRMENLTLGYKLNLNKLDWVKMANIYITGQNLFVITKYKGYDPEVRNGIDMTNYPRPRNIVLGMRFTF